MSTATETDARVRWRRRKTARPGEILDAALAAFAEHGFAATRLDDVAERAGITKGTLYLYFPSKEDLFKAVVRQQLLPNIERAEALAANTAVPSLVLLEQLVGFFSQIMRSPLSAISKLVLTEAGNFPDLARFYLEEVVDRGKALLRGVLDRGIAAGELRPIDSESAATCTIAPLLVGSLWRHSFERHAGRPLDIDALCRTHFDLLRRGLVAEPGSARSDKAGAR